MKIGRFNFKYVLGLIILIISFSYCKRVEEVKVDGHEYYQKIFHDLHGEFQNIIEDLEGNFLIVGSELNDPFVISDDGIIIMKINDFGEVIWQKKIAQKKNQSYPPKLNVQILFNKNILIGNELSDQLILLSPDGDILFNIDFDLNSNDAAALPWYTSKPVIGDDNFIYVSKYNYNFVSSFLGKIDISSGNVLEAGYWDLSVYPFPEHSLYTRFELLKVENNIALISVDWKPLKKDSNNVLQLNGSERQGLLSYQLFSGSIHAIINRVTLTPSDFSDSKYTDQGKPIATDGEFYYSVQNIRDLAQHHRFDFYKNFLQVYKAKHNLDTVWKKRIRLGGSITQISPIHLLPLPSGEVLITVKAFENNEYKYILVKLDSEGNVVSINNNLPENIIVKSTLISSQNKIILVGSSTKIGTGGNEYITSKATLFQIENKY